MRRTCIQLAHAAASRFRVFLLSALISTSTASVASAEAGDILQRITIPLLDLSTEKQRQVVVDREPGQYLGHVTTVLLEDGRTILATYPKGHGRGPIVMKRSDDAGLTWSERLPTPASWATSMEVPTIHRVIDAQGKRRLILWSGLYPARLAVSEDDGRTWSELKPAGEWGGIVTMSALVPLREPGHYVALFHDDGRFFAAEEHVEKPKRFTLYQTRSADGGLTWSAPQTILNSTEMQLCEPGAIRSPDGSQLAVLLRENGRRRNSQIIFSGDDGKTWSKPRDLPLSLTGDRHTLKYAGDGRLIATFRDRTYNEKALIERDVDKMGRGSPHEGDWVAWIGSWDDLKEGREGQYRVRLMDNRWGWDTAYPGLEVLADGTVVTTSYGRWEADELPYIVSVRFTLKELDERARAGTTAPAH